MKVRIWNGDYYWLISIIFSPIISGPPNPPIITHIEANRNALKVTWQEPPSKQDTPITGHVLKIKKKGQQPLNWKQIALKTKSNYFIVRNLTRATHYRVRLFATNVVGYSNSSAEREVRTLWEGECIHEQFRKITLY